MATKAQVKADIHEGLVDIGCTLPTPSTPSTVGLIFAISDVIVDKMYDGIDFLENVKSIYNPTTALPATPAIGDSYVSSATARGWTANHVYQWSGNLWIDTPPIEGMIKWIDDQDLFYYYSGSAWLKFGTQFEHGLDDHTDVMTTGAYVPGAGNFLRWTCGAFWASWAPGQNLTVSGFSAQYLSGHPASDFALSGHTHTSANITDFATASRALFSGSTPITYNSTTGAIGITQSGIDHGSIGGLDHDDHTQYYNQSRGDARYAPISHAVNASTYGYGDGTVAGHLRVGTGLGITTGTVSVTYGATGTTACVGNDSRLSDSRTPVSHAVNASTYGYGDGTVAGHLRVGTGLGITTGTVSVAYGTTGTTACVGNDSRLSDSRTPVSHAVNASTYGYGDGTNAGHVRAGTGLTALNGTFSVAYGNTGTTACAGDDSRLSNARTPTAHTLGSHSDYSTYIDQAVKTGSTVTFGGITSTSYVKITSETLFPMNSGYLSGTASGYVGLTGNASGHICYRAYGGSEQTIYSTGNKPSPSDLGAAPTSHAVNASTYGYGDTTNAGHARAGTGLTSLNGTFSVSYGTTGSTACAGNDSRLSDARTPVSHTLGSHSDYSTYIDQAVKQASSPTFSGCTISAQTAAIVINCGASIYNGTVLYRSNGVDKAGLRYDTPSNQFRFIDGGGTTMAYFDISDGSLVPCNGIKNASTLWKFGDPVYGSAGATDMYLKVYCNGQEFRVPAKFIG